MRDGSGSARRGTGSGIGSGAGGVAGSGTVLDHGTRLPKLQSQKTSVPAWLSGRPCVLPHFLHANQIMLFTLPPSLRQGQSVIPRRRFVALHGRGAGGVAI